MCVSCEPTVRDDEVREGERQSARVTGACGRVVGGLRAGQGAASGDK